MTDIHKDLPSATFVRPDGIVERTVCRTTGCLASRNCTNTYTEIFTEDNLPEQCTNHRKAPKETLGLWTPLNRNRSRNTNTNTNTNTNINTNTNTNTNR